VLSLLDFSSCRGEAFYLEARSIDFDDIQAEFDSVPEPQRYKTP
jgi:hypothetical protein